jgi:hypothetical protein
MKTQRLIATALSFTFTLLLASTGFGQGSLTPPAGPPAPTMRTLDQVEARTIVNAKNTPGDATNTYIISAAGPRQRLYREQLTVGRLHPLSRRH